MKENLKKKDREKSRKETKQKKEGMTKKEKSKVEVIEGVMGWVNNKRMKRPIKKEQMSVRESGKNEEVRLRKATLLLFTIDK